jgi:hypothetical protein
MTRRPCTFKQGDVTRALKAAKKAGVDVQVEIDLEHKRIFITPLKAGEAGQNTAPAEVVVMPLDEWRAKRRGEG